MGEIDPRSLEALELVAPIAALELDLDVLLAGDRRDRALPASVAVPAVEDRPRVRRRRRRGCRRRGADAAGRRAATSSRTSRCSTSFGPSRWAPAGRASRSRVRLPCCRPDAHRRRGRASDGKRRSTAVTASTTRLTLRGCTTGTREGAPDWYPCGPASGERTDFYAVLGVPFRRARATRSPPPTGPGPRSSTRLPPRTTQVAAERFKNVSAAYRRPVRARNPARVRPVPPVLRPPRRPWDRCRGRRLGARPTSRARPGVTTVVTARGGARFQLTRRGARWAVISGVICILVLAFGLRLARPRARAPRRRPPGPGRSTPRPSWCRRAGAAVPASRRPTGRVVLAEMPQTSRSGQIAPVGEQLKIRYDPNDPTTSSPTRTRRLATSPCGSCPGKLLICGPILVVVGAFRLRRPVTPTAEGTRPWRAAVRAQVRPRVRGGRRCRASSSTRTGSRTSTSRARGSSSGWATSRRSRSSTSST